MKSQIDRQYLQHRVFTQLNQYADFYGDLADSVMGWKTMGTYSIINLDTYQFSSIQGTLSSIQNILVRGRISDAYTLLRKYHDSTIINVYTILYLEDNLSFDEIIVQRIENWINGKEPLPEYRITSQYVKNSDKVNAITHQLDAKIYREIRQRCNDHTHYNTYDTILMNDREVFLKNRLSVLNTFSMDLENLFIQHMSYLFYLNSHYMMSSDYVDYLDAGRQPPPDCENWVAPFIQEIFNKVINVKRPDIVMTIRKRTAMQLV